MTSDLIVEEMRARHGPAIVAPVNQHSHSRRQEARPTIPTLSSGNPGQAAVVSDRTNLAQSPNR